jgi:chorismate-pyruvate lyase
MTSHLLASWTASPDTTSAEPYAGNLWAEAMPSQRLNDYLALQGSTTFFLEAVAGLPVEVEVLGQCIEAQADGSEVLRRRSRLYVRDPGNILLVAESSIQLACIDAEQRQRLLDGSVGIGKLFDPHDRGLLEKTDLETLRVPAPRSLRTESTWAISRRYAMRLNGAHCVEVSEILNNESLERAR